MIGPVLRVMSVMLAVLVVGVAVLLGVRSAIDVEPARAGLDADRQMIGEISRAFIEDIRFADFESIRSYVARGDLPMQKTEQRVALLFGVDASLLRTAKFTLGRAVMANGGDRAHIAGTLVLSARRSDLMEIVHFRLDFRRASGRWLLSLPS